MQNVEFRYLSRSERFFASTLVNCIDFLDLEFYADLQVKGEIQSAGTQVIG